MNLKLNKVPDTETSEPYYDIFMGGYYPAESLSDDPETQDKINEAIRVVNEIVEHLENNDLIY